jgi:Tfp pilus assembly protein PilO
MEGDGKMREETFNKPLSLNVSTKLVVAIILFLVILVLFYMYVVTPKINEINALNDQISKAEERLNLLLLAQEKLSSIEREINLYNDRLVVLKQILPPQSDEFLFAEEFVAIANKSGGKITSLNFEKSNQQQQNALPTFTLSYEGPKYDNILSFNKLLKDNYPQIINIVQLSISKLVDQSGSIKYIANVKGVINLSQRK